MKKFCKNKSKFVQSFLANVGRIGIILFPTNCEFLKTTICNYIVSKKTKRPFQVWLPVYISRRGEKIKT